MIIKEKKKPVYLLRKRYFQYNEINTGFQLKLFRYFENKDKQALNN